MNKKKKAAYEKWQKHSKRAEELMRGYINFYDLSNDNEEIEAEAEFWKMVDNEFEKMKIAFEELKNLSH